MTRPLAEPRLLHALPVIESWDEGSVFRGVRVQAPKALLDRYQVPGQYLELQLPDDRSARGYFALAAAPGRPTLELLLRRGSVLADRVAALDPGQGQVLSTGIHGTGFALDLQQHRNLLLIGAGSGIAPLRAVIQSVLSRRQRFNRVALYYGQRRSCELAYKSEFADWERGGIGVIPVLSGDAAAGQRGGYVQAHLLLAPPEHVGPQTSAFLCGMRAMVDEAARVLEERGVPRDRILLNY